MITKMHKLIIVLMVILVIVLFSIMEVDADNNPVKPLPKDFKNFAVWSHVFTSGQILGIYHDKEGHDVVAFLTKDRLMHSTQIGPGVVVPEYNNCLSGMFMIAATKSNDEPIRAVIEVLAIIDISRYQRKEQCDLGSPKVKKQEL